MQKFFFLFFAVILIGGCQNNKGTTISGTIKGAQQLEGTLDETMLSQNLLLSKIKFESDGKFSVNMPDGMKAGLYRIKIGAKQMNLILNGSEKNITIDADLATLNGLNYVVKGSEDTESYINTFSEVIKDKKPMPELEKTIENTKNPLLGMLMMMQVQAFAGPEYADQHVSAVRFQPDLPSFVVGIELQRLAVTLAARQRRDGLRQIRE